MTFLVLYSYYKYKTEGLDISTPHYTVDRNFFAESIVAVLPLAFMFFENAKNKILKVIFLGIAAIMAMGVILTYSRGGLLAFFIVLFFLFLQSKKKIVMVVFGFVILMLFLPHIGQKYTDRINTVKTYEEDASAMARVATWQSAINMFKEKPITGVGAGNFNDLFLDYCPSEEIPGKRLDETPLDSPIGERRHEIFRYVKPGETLAEAIKREEDPRIDFVLNRVYRIPTEGERVTTNSLERYLVPKPRESTK